MTTKFGILAGLVFFAATFLAGATVTEKREGPLAQVPSPPGPHMAKIEALGDNQWLNLGKPTPDPKWGPALGRSWGGKMAYAPDLMGGFIGGQGPHGAVKADGHFDDWFFYDINGNRWVCVFPGVNVTTLVEDIKKGDAKMSDDGQLVAKDGQPLIYVGGHMYEGHTYDTDLHRYIYLGGRNMLIDQHTVGEPWWKEAEPLLQAQMKGKTDKSSHMPTYFDTRTGKWERPAVKNFAPSGGGPGGIGQYLPSKKAIWIRSDRIWLFDPKTGETTDMHTTGTGPQGGDPNSCYDSKRDRIYVCGRNYAPPYAPGEGVVFYYDVKTNAWGNVPNKGAFPPAFSASISIMCYDAVNDAVVVYLHGTDHPGIFVFNPATSSWNDEMTPLPADLPPSGYWNGAKSGFYSPEVNAHFYYFVGDGRGDGEMWAYRYKRPAAAKKK